MREGPLLAGGSPEGPSGSTELPPIFDDLGDNRAAAKRQKMWLYGIIGAGAFAAVTTVLATHSGSPATSPVSDPATATTASGINTDQMTAASLADTNYRAINENRLDSLENQIKGMTGNPNANPAEVARLNEQLQAARAQQGFNRSQIRAPQLQGGGGDPRDAEIAALKGQILTMRQSGLPHTAPARTGPGGAPPMSPGGTGYSGLAAPGTIGVPGGIGGATVKVDTFAASAGGKIAERSNLLFANSVNYLPPNSIATATVIVGADAQAGVRTQAEPIPVVLRITSNARSVAQEGRMLMTAVTGCLVNGAAYADLSSEKVFVKLQKMTCNDDRGGVAVSEVKGFVAFAGKAGVRGHVVSREGSFILKSFLAGLVGGIGKLGQNVAQSQLYNTYSTNGAKPPIDLSTIGLGAAGSGVSSGSDAVSKYLIERAEQYQPVVEMPTGVSVEVVFLDGGYIR